MKTYKVTYREYGRRESNPVKCYHFTDKTPLGGDAIFGRGGALLEAAQKAAEVHLGAEVVAECHFCICGLSKGRKAAIFEARHIRGEGNGKTLAMLYVRRIN